tara:strand:+ start:1387 stop:2094 length:708 start_codon:yes stop_codon:yes gene_type:complete
MPEKDFNKTLAAATLELATIDDKRKAPTRGGKKYTMVADRVRIFRKHFGVDAQIDTIQTFDQHYVRSDTTISVGGERVANGIAEEDRRFGMINKTSAAENAETSSIGRALANLGLQGGEYPSGDEVLIAIAQQNKKISASNNVVSAEKKSNQSTTSNKANSGSSQPDLALPSGWDTLDLVKQIQHFSSVIEKASHPGNLRELATPFKHWIEGLDENNKKEVVGMYNNKNIEVKSK